MYSKTLQWSFHILKNRNTYSGTLSMELKTRSMTRFRTPSKHFRLGVMSSFFSKRVGLICRGKRKKRDTWQNYAVNHMTHAHIHAESETLKSPNKYWLLSVQWTVIRPKNSTPGIALKSWNEKQQAKIVAQRISNGSFWEKVHHYGEKKGVPNCLIRSYPKTPLCLFF